MKRTAEYWQRYRRVRSSVAKHLSTIGSESANGDEFDNTGSEPNSCATESGISELNLTAFQNQSNQTGSTEDSSHFSADDFTSSVNESNSGLSDTFGQGSSLFLDSDVEDAESMFNSDPSDCDSSESSSLDDSDLAYDLSIWASQFNIPHNAVKDLLNIVRPSHHMLPKDPRTLP